MAAQNDTPSVGDQLDAAITEKRTTQTAVAKKAGLSTSYVGKILAGGVRKPSDDKLRRLEKALGLERGYFKVPTTRRAAEDPIARIEARMEAALNNQGKTLRAIEELARAVDGLTDLVETTLTKASPVPQRKRRTA